MQVETFEPEAPETLEFLHTFNPAAFAKDRLGFTPDARQRLLLQKNPHYCLLNCTRQWGKSTVTAARAVHQAFFNPESLTLALSPSARQSSEFMRKSGAFLRRLGIKPRGDGDNEISLLLPNGSRIVGLPGKESTVRGFSSVSLLLIDEAARVDDDLYRAMRPMLAVGNGALWLMSTPHGRRGFFYEAWANGGPEWERVQVPAHECPRIPAAHLQQERAVMGERWFRQEYLCEFVDSDDQMVSLDVLKGALSTDFQALRRYPFSRVSPAAPMPKGVLRTLDHRFYIGVDLGQIRDHTAIAIVEKYEVILDARSPIDLSHPREMRVGLRYLERIPLNTPYPEVAAHIGAITRWPELAGRCALTVDATGPGLPVVQSLSKYGVECLIKPVFITGGAMPNASNGIHRIPKRDLLSTLIIQLEDGTIRIANDLDEAPRLIEEMTNLRIKIKSTGNEIIEPWREGQHDDMVFALALAAWDATRKR